MAVLLHAVFVVLVVGGVDKDDILFVYIAGDGHVVFDESDSRVILHDVVVDKVNENEKRRGRNRKRNETAPHPTPPPDLRGDRHLRGLSHTRSFKAVSFPRRATFPSLFGLKRKPSEANI